MEATPAHHLPVPGPLDVVWGRGSPRDDALQVDGGGRRDEQFAVAENANLGH